MAEVFGGLLHGDPSGFNKNALGWKPSDEAALATLLPDGPENGDDWQVADLLRAAGASVNDADVANTIATGLN